MASPSSAHVPDSQTGTASVAPLASTRVYGWMLALTIITGLELGLLLLDISPILPLVRQKYAVTYVAAGWAISATLIGHTVTVVVAGFLASRVGSRTVALTGLTLLALSAVGRALAPNFAALVASRAVTGVGTGCLVIAGINAITLLSPPQRRVRDQGFFGAAQQLGIMLTLLVAPTGVARLGMPVYWGLMAVEVTLVLVVCLLRYPQPRESVRPAPRAMPRALLADGYGWLLSLANMAGYGVFVGVTAWMATFFVERFHTSLQQTALLTSVATLFAVLGRLGASPLLTMMNAHWLIGGFVTLTAASLALVPFAPDERSAALLLLLFAIGSNVPFGAVFGSIPERLSSHGLAPRVMLITLNSNLTALMLPVYIGFTVSVTGGFSLGFWSLAALASVIALVLLRSPVGRGPRVAVDTTTSSRAG
jgi:NNP family nitrate/nitrite transporter-like MFS transporter